MIDQVEAMLNENKEHEEALLREVCSLKDEQMKMKKDINEIKVILKEFLDAGTS